MHELQLITNAVIEAGVDIAPTYQEYFELCMAIVDTYHEEGRPFFHRLCEINPTYDFKKADLFYSRCLRDSRGNFSLGTLIHLADRAGIKKWAMGMGKNEKVCQFATLPPASSASKEPRARYIGVKEQHDGAENDENREKRAENAKNDAESGKLLSQNGKLLGENGKLLGENGKLLEADGKLSVMMEKSLIALPGFKIYEWPGFLQQMLLCAPSLKQRDGLLLSVLTVLGASLNWTVHSFYGYGPTYPNLMTFVAGKSAAGKSIMNWARQLAEPIHQAQINQYRQNMEVYNKKKQEMEGKGKESKAQPLPEEPVRRLFIIPGNNSATGIKDNLIASNGVGLIFETEADSMSIALSSDYGHWTDTLRKGYDNDEISFARRMGNEYKQCRHTCFSVMLTGTFGQVTSLIPARNDGTFSRFLFYNLPPVKEWMNQFNENRMDYNALFLHWGEGWKRFLDLLRAHVSSIELRLTEEQQEAFNEHLSQLFNRSVSLHDETMTSSVTRLAMNLVRIMCTVAFLRAVDHLLTEGDPFNQRWQEKEVQRHFCEELLCSPYFRLPESVPKENGHDGTWSTLDMFISDADFTAILSMAEVLTAHSSFALGYLSRDKVQPEPITESSLLQRMPVEFKREEALRVAQEMGLSTRKLDRILSEGVEKHTLVRTRSGHYAFTSMMKGAKKKGEEEKKEENQEKETTEE